MSEYIGKINIPKHTMLHIVNNIFNKNIKETTTKENILKIISEIYTKENFEDLIKLLPYKSYLILEKLIEFTKESEDINKFHKQTEYAEVRYLEEAMIIVLRAKYNEYSYSLNPNVLENLTELFNENNRKLAEKYGQIEKLTKGILYAYGVVDFNFFRTLICKYMNEIITEDELNDLYFKRLNLNLFVDYFNVRWIESKQTQNFITYLDEDDLGIDLGDIADEQRIRNFNYKKFTKKEILERTEFVWDDTAEKLYEFLEKKNIYLTRYGFERIAKRNQIGINILSELSEKISFDTDEEMNEFSNLFMDWYNNSPQYLLNGYSPNEFRKMLKR